MYQASSQSDSGGGLGVCLPACVCVCVRVYVCVHASLRSGARTEDLELPAEKLSSSGEEVRNVKQGDRVLGFNEYGMS